MAQSNGHPLSQPNGERKHRGASVSTDPFDQLLEEVPAGVCTCDTDGLITSFNSRAVELWGRAPSLNDPVDRYCGSFRLYSVDGKPVAHDQCWMARAIHDRRPYQGCEIRIEREDGTHVTALSHVSPRFDAKGELIGAVNVLVDITERKLEEEALRRSEEELADCFEKGSIGMHWVGADGIVLHVNQAELDMLGYGREEYVGHHIAEFHVDGPVIDEILRRLTAGETLRSFEARLRCRDGSIKQVAISSSVFWRDGQFVHTRCFTQDITSLKQVEAYLQSRDQRKNEFLALLGHELRTPLSPIVNAIQLLRMQGPVDPVLDGARDLIDRQVAHMARLIDDLLDVARISRGTMTLRRSTFTLAEVVNDALEVTRPLVDSQHHELTVELPEAEVVLEADKVRITQAVSNLIGNAAKYTEAGGRIKLEANCPPPEHGQPRLLELTVTDSGIGIPLENQDSIFEMFAQLEHGADRTKGGLGVGLTLVQSILEMHGGSIEARSAGLGCGSEFIARLPLPMSNSPLERTPLERTPQASPVVPSRPRRVLVVDDHPDAAHSLCRVLELFGHESRFSQTGVEALRLADEFEPEVILLDIGLPDIDGYEVCRQLRARPWAVHVDIVAITGWGQREDLRKARDAGFDAHLTKPVDLAQLRQRLASERPTPERDDS